MKALLIALIKFYKLNISNRLLPMCKHYPPCSEYAILALEKHGVVKGSFKGLFRLLRCNPLTKGRVDFP